MIKLEIDPNAGIPLVEQIESGIRNYIDQGNRIGTRLPSIRQLAGECGVSRNTVVEAYQRLVSKGFLRSHHGSGHYIAQTSAPSPMDTEAQDEETTEALVEQPWRLFLERPGRIKLGCGWLPESWRQPAGLAQAVRQVAREGRTGLFQYSTPLGSPELRMQLQRGLQLLGINTQADRIMLTTGASHGLDLIIRHLLKPGDLVFVESPGYYNLIGLLRYQGMQMIGIPRTAKGPDLDVLEAMLALHRPKLFFVNSIFQNPTGTTLTAAVGHRILQLADRHGFLVVEDDIYSDFEEKPTIRMATLDQLARVIYVGSFSKTLSCSLRVGFVTADAKIVANLADLKMLTSIASSRFAEDVVTVILENGSYRHTMKCLRRRLGRQMLATLRLLQESGWELFAEPAGGMFVWARWPGIEDARVLVESALDHGIDLSSGSSFLHDAQACPWLRINVAYATEPRAIAFLRDPMPDTVHERVHAPVSPIGADEAKFAR